MLRAKEMSPDQIIIGNLSGRGDKDVQEAARVLGIASTLKP
jgi:tryptophan synthase beta subunit